MPYRYIGAGKRIYPAYLNVDPDGGARTLIGVPGGAPVADIRPAQGGRIAPLPGDGLWVPAPDPPQNAADLAAPAQAADPGESSTPTATPAPTPPKPPARSRKASR